MTAGRKVAYLIMICLIVKHVMAGSYGPLDRLLEIGVFALIAYEVIVGVFERRKKRKAKSTQIAIVGKLTEFMEGGQQLRESVPRPLDQAEMIPAWEKSVSEWATKTNDYLIHHSTRAASAAFCLVAEPTTNDLVIHPKGGYSFRISGQFGVHYKILLVQLENLRQIIVKTEVYF